MPFRASYLAEPKPRAAPRPPAPRHDGFSPAQQRLFLQTLAATASVTRAAQAAGVCRTTAYNHRHDPRARDFRDGWAAALARAVEVAVDVALERAVDGVEEPVFQRGEQVGTRIRHDPRLLRFLIEQRDRIDTGHTEIGYDGTEIDHRDYPPARLAACLDRIDPPPRGPEPAALAAARAARRESASTSSSSPDNRRPRAGGGRCPSPRTASPEERAVGPRHGSDGKAAPPTASPAPRTPPCPPPPAPAP